MPATSSSPSALRRAATTAEVPTRHLSTVESITLLQALEAVPYPRQRRGRRHLLQSVRYLALGAVVRQPTTPRPVSGHRPVHTLPPAASVADELDFCWTLVPETRDWRLYHL